MAHYRLKSLRVRNFRSFIEEVLVEFPESGLVLFNGLNLDTKGSSGAGKSTLLLAITYALGFCRFPATALQSWLTEDPLFVELVVHTDKGPLVITRSPGLSVTLNGANVPGSAAQREAKISEVLGLSTELLAALTYQGQKKSGAFIKKTDSDKKEFLTTVLGLERFEKAIEASEKLAKTHQTQVDADQLVVKTFETELAEVKPVEPAKVQDESALKRDLEAATLTLERIGQQTQTIKSSLNAKQAKIDQAVREIEASHAKEISELEYAIEELEGGSIDPGAIDDAHLTELEAMLAQGRAFLKEEQATDEKKRQAQKLELVAVEKDLASARVRTAQIPVFEANQIRYQAQINAMQANTCPTCDQAWNDSGDALKQLEDKMEGEFEGLLDARGWIKDVAFLEAKANDLRVFTPDPALEKLKLIEQQLAADIQTEKTNIASSRKVLEAQAKAQIAEARGALDKLLREIGQQAQLYRNNAEISMSDDQDVLETLEREVAMARAHQSGLQSMLNRVQIDNARELERAAGIEARREGVRIRLEAAHAKLVQAQALLNAELDFQKMIGREGFLGSIFDEVLSEISDETNQLLARFPNTSHLTLYFRSESTNQKGGIKKSIVPVVSIAGHEAPLESGCSGGMETAVEQAVDLAVARVVSRRSGAMPGWIIRDESFTGLGPVEMEACMDVLSDYAKDSLVLVVDHSSEFKAMFPKSIDIVFQGGKSWIQKEKA